MKNLCRALIWNACFLELSDHIIIDPDSAVKALEDMTSILQSATKEEKEAFTEACIDEHRELTRKGNPEYDKAARFILGLPDAFGIRE